MIRINDLFLTIQGEGVNAGRAAVFIRMPFCNLSCPWCDTEYNTYKEYSPLELYEYLKSQKTRLAVITGGEPSFNKQTPVVLETLLVLGYEVAMESNGQFPAPEGLLYHTISPKRWNTKDLHAVQKHEPFWFDKSNTPTEIKLVVDSPEVLDVATLIYDNWLHGIFKFKNEMEPRFYLSPECNQKETILPLIIEYVKNNPQWRINHQTHKWMGVK